MSITLDIAAIVGAFIWPVVLLVILLVYRKKIPSLFEGLASRVTKVGFAGFSLELAVAKPVATEWSESAGALDLRHKATAIQVSDSTARTFLTQLTEETSGDYAVVDLGTGKEWLTSRLFILSIVFARMKGIQHFVFVETSGNVRKRYVGCIEPEKIHWTLSKQYPWLEQAYADAYSVVFSQQRSTIIVSNQGRLGDRFSPRSPDPSLDLLKEFLQRIQAPPAIQPTPPDLENWILIDPTTSTYEHASWLDSEKVEAILGSDFATSAIPAAELRSKNAIEQLRAFIPFSGRFVAVTAEDRRFEYLVDRSIILEQVAKGLSSGTDRRS